MISIHALLAESDTWARGSRVTYVISIHALLAESDLAVSAVLQLIPLISIHALLAESDSPPSVTPAASRKFYPRSPCGERRSQPFFWDAKMLFLSTLSLRRATVFPGCQPWGYRISIHALLAESDWLRTGAGSMLDISIHALLAESDRPL